MDLEAGRSFELSEAGVGPNRSSSAGVHSISNAQATPQSNPTSRPGSASRSQSYTTAPTAPNKGFQEVAANYIYHGQVKLEVKEQYRQHAPFAVRTFLNSFGMAIAIPAAQTSSDGHAIAMFAFAAALFATSLSFSVVLHTMLNLPWFKPALRFEKGAALEVITYFLVRTMEFVQSSCISAGLMLLGEGLEILGVLILADHRKKIGGRKPLSFAGHGTF